MFRKFFIISVFICSLAYCQNTDDKFLVHWSSNEMEILCSVKEDQSHSMILSFYKDTLEKNNILFFYNSGGDSPISLFQDKDDSGNFITVWQSGSAYHIVVFGVINGKIEKALDTGAKCFPEFVFNKNNDYNIIISEHQWLVDRKTNDKALVPQSAYIYKWNGVKYIKSDKTKWSQRLQKAFSF
jgi:hypothetical protein